MDDRATHTPAARVAASLTSSEVNHWILTDQTVKTNRNHFKGLMKAAWRKRRLTFVVKLKCVDCMLYVCWYTWEVKQTEAALMPLAAIWLVKQQCVQNSHSCVDTSKCPEIRLLNKLHILPLLLLVCTILWWHYKWQVNYLYNN